MLADEIKSFLKGEVATDAPALDKFSVDASIFKLVPRAVVSPLDKEDLAALIKFAAAKKQAGEDISLSARSAGTDMSGGPLTQQIVVDFMRHFNVIHEIGSDYAVVEPGVFYRDFEKETDARGLVMPSYPASKHLCALGGMVSNNSGGEKTLAYGKTEKYVRELEVVLANGDICTFKPLNKNELHEKLELQTFEGEIYRQTYKLIEDNYDLIQAARPRVSKNSAGYFLWNVWDRTTFDLTKLIVGSQGTLAFVTKIKFALIKKKTHSRLAVIFMKDLAPLAHLAQEVLKFSPESFESFDDHTFLLSIRFIPQLIKRMKGNAIKLGLSFLPELFMVLRGGVPKLILLVELTGDDEQEIVSRMRRMEQALKAFPVHMRVMHSEAEGQKYWTMRHESFNLLRNKVKDRQTAPFIDDFIIVPERLPEFLPKLNDILAPYGKVMTYTIAGHVGDGNFHIIPLMNLHDEAARKAIPELMEKVYDLVLEFHGSITAEHNDGLVRSPYLKKMYGPEVYALFEQTKKIFDPLNILNPGKKVGSDLAFSLAHIK